jgi:DNA-binding LacI/PurR family transcriptional regulator
MATLRDVARLAGTSVAAASEVLNGSGKHNIRVGQDTRARILSAARHVEYRPNAIARALSSKRTNIIGLYSGYRYLDPRNAFFAEIVGGLQEGCLEHRKDLLLHSVFRGDSVEDIYSELMDGRIDGLVMNAPPEDPLVERLAASHLPVVVVADAVPSLPSVVVDDMQAARLTFDHLAGRGHMRLLYLDVDRRVGSAERRRDAYHRVALGKGLDLLVWRAPSGTEETDTLLDSWREMPSSRRPTAAVCWNDIAAHELLANCHRRGVRVPEELAVVGFDGDPNPTAFRWRLTTVRAPWAAVARTALKLLVARIEGETGEEGESAREITLPVEFIAGDSG